MTLKPLHDWAVIRPSEADEVTAGGLYIPDTAKDKPQEGIVEAVGPGAYEEEKGKKEKDEKKERRFIPTTVRPGDRVIYGRYAGQTYKIDGEERILVRERDILGILPERGSAQPKPLQIPPSTTGSGSAALVKPAQIPAQRPQPLTGERKAAPKKAVKKAVKKRAVKAKAKKSAAKPVRKSHSKKSSTTRKTGKKK